MCRRSVTCRPVATRANSANPSCRSHPTTTGNALSQRQLRSRRSSTCTPCLGEIKRRSHKCRRRFQALSANYKRRSQTTRCGELDEVPLQEATAYTTKQLHERLRSASTACVESFCKDSAGQYGCSIPLPYSRVTGNTAHLVSERQEVEQTHFTKRGVNAANHSQDGTHPKSRLAAACGLAHRI